ncbi:MAG: hypothetical protein ACPGWR_01150 [Ardenticatenaceae bacterium]
MYTVILKYVLPIPVPRQRLVDIFKASEARFRAMPKLIRKQFCYDEATHTGHSVYLWESEADARAFFKDEFLTRFEAKFGARPELIYIDTLMVIDNEAGKTTMG